MEYEMATCFGEEFSEYLTNKATWMFSKANRKGYLGKK